MAPKINKPFLSSGNQSISEAKAAAEKRTKELINFSFKYLDGETEEFKFNSCEGNYFVELINRIKNLSTLTPQDIYSNRSSSLKAHPIDWSDTSKKGFGFPKEEEIVETPYQFSVNRNEHGRVHGFFIYNTFYVVWLDKDHNLY